MSEANDVKDATPITYFAPGTSFEGNLHSTSDIEIAGDFSGEIVCEGAVTLRANTNSAIAAKALELVSASLTGDVIVSENVLLDHTSSITGNVRAISVDNAGAINGNIAVKDYLSLQSGSRVTGDIKAATLDIARGAKVSGSVDMGLSEPI